MKKVSEMTGTRAVINRSLFKFCFNAKTNCVVFQKLQRFMLHSMDNSLLSGEGVHSLSKHQNWIKRLDSDGIREWATVKWHFVREKWTKKYQVNKLYVSLSRSMNLFNRLNGTLFTKKVEASREGAEIEKLMFDCNFVISISISNR